SGYAQSAANLSAICSFDGYFNFAHSAGSAPVGGAVHAPAPMTGVHLSSLMRFNSRSQVLSSNSRPLFGGRRAFDSTAADSALSFWFVRKLPSVHPIGMKTLARYPRKFSCPRRRRIFRNTPDAPRDLDRFHLEVSAPLYC